MDVLSSANADYHKMAYHEAKHNFITTEHSQTEGEGEKKIGGGVAGLAKVSWAAAAPQ